MEIKDLEQFEALADRLNARFELDPEYNSIKVYMPPTKRQKNGQGDTLFLSEANTLEQNLQTAYNFMIEWEEIWSLRLSVTNVQIKEYLRKRLSEDKQALRAMELIYNYQTPTEQSHKRTELRNNIGFSGVDAELMTSFVNQYKTRGFLSKKQMEIVRRVMKKYWRQVKEASDEKKLLTMVKRAQPESIQLELPVNA